MLVRTYVFIEQDLLDCWFFTSAAFMPVASSEFQIRKMISYFRTVVLGSMNETYFPLRQK